MLHGRDILPMERDRLVNSLIELIAGIRASNPKDCREKTCAL